MAYLPEIRNFFVEVAKGNVAGHTPFHFMGERDSIGNVATGTDVWQGVATTIPLPSSSGEQMTLVSTSVNDTAAGTGMRTVTVDYLDAAGNPQMEVVTLNGTTPVNTAATNIRFVQSLSSASVGTGGVAVGDVTIYKVGDAATVYCKVAAGGNMSLSAIRMVPNGKTLYLTDVLMSSSGGKRVVLRLRTTSDMDGNLKPGIYMFKASVNLTDSSAVIDGQPPLKVPGLAVIKVSAWTDTAGASASVHACGFLV